MIAYRSKLEDLNKKFGITGKKIKEKEQLYIEFIKRNSVK